MTGDDALALLDAVVTAVRGALGDLDDWGLAGTRAGQYHSDLTADAAALAVLDRAGVGVLSEESGRHRPDAPVTVVVDPVDGSTNASRGIPWYACSVCAVDATGPLAAVVANLASDVTFRATRGGGAWCAGERVRPSACGALRTAVVGLSGYPPRYLGWKQFRAMGAAALDLCAVAAGVLDGYVDCSRNAHGPWDYLGGVLVCQEAGAVVSDGFDRDLVVLDQDARRTPVAAATTALHAELVEARRSFG
jgi:fructose-1,6-bisphosphatase/inositol monophosphatase family enzyme